MFFFFYDKKVKVETKTSSLTLPSHSHFETFLKSTILTLVPMVLIYRTVPTPPTGVVQVPPDTPLEETFTSWNKRGVERNLFLEVCLHHYLHCLHCMPSLSPRHASTVSNACLHCMPPLSPLRCDSWGIPWGFISDFINACCHSHKVFFPSGIIVIKNMY